MGATYAIEVDNAANTLSHFVVIYESRIRPLLLKKCFHQLERDIEDLCGRYNSAESSVQRNYPNVFTSYLLAIAYLQEITRNSSTTYGLLMHTIDSHVFCINRAMQGDLFYEKGRQHWHKRVIAKKLNI